MIFLQSQTLGVQGHTDQLWMTLQCGLNTLNGANLRRGETSTYPPFASAGSAVCAVYAVRCFGGSKNRNSRNPRNPPKFTKSSVYINTIQSSARKSTSRKRKLSKSNVISHEINGFHKIQYCLRNQLIRTHSIENIRLVC